MNKTNDFKYNLPAYSDPVDIEDLNDNFRGIDDALMAGLCKKDYTGNNMGSSDPSARKYAWAPWLEIVNDNEFDVVVTDRNAPVESEEATINIAAGQTFRKYINGRYYMNFYVQDQYDVTFKWFTNAETYINESGGGGGGTGTVTSVSVQGGSGSHLTGSGNPIETSGTIIINVDEGYSIPSDNEQTAWSGKQDAINSDNKLNPAYIAYNSDHASVSEAEKTSYAGKQDAIDSSHKLSADNVDDTNATNKFVSASDKTAWNAKYDKPSGGIPSSDMSQAVRTSLGLADSALQSETDPTVPSWAKQSSKPSYNSDEISDTNKTHKFATQAQLNQISTNQTNILYALNTGVKNLSPADSCNVSASTYLLKDVLVDNINAGTYVFMIKTTSATASGIQVIFSNGVDAITNRTGSYTLIPSAGNVTYHTFNVSAGTTHMTLYVNNAAVIPEIMICTEDAWNQSQDYQPYALPNYDLTRLEAEDRASLAEVVDSGAKNKAQTNAFTIDTDDGYLLGHKADLVAGQRYVVSYKTTAVDSGTLMIGIKNSSGTALLDFNVNNGVGYAEFTCPTGFSYYNVQATKAGTFSDFMICTKAAFGVSSKFVPYRPNYDLVVSDLNTICFKRLPMNSSYNYRGFIVEANRAVVQLAIMSNNYVFGGVITLAYNSHNSMTANVSANFANMSTYVKFYKLPNENVAIIAYTETKWDDISYIGGTVKSTDIEIYQSNTAYPSGATEFTPTAFPT